MSAKLDTHPKQVVAKAKQSRRKMVAIGASIFAMLVLFPVIITAIGNHGDKSASSITDSRAAIAKSAVPVSSSVVLGAYSAPVLNIAIRVTAGDDGIIAFHAAADAMATIAADVAAGRPLAKGPVTSINVEIAAGDRRIAHFTAQAAELADQARRGLSGDEILARAHEIGFWTAGNEQLARAYCAAYPVAAAFCARL
jgi:hypothetical protein